MSAYIHPTAVVDEGAKIGEGTKVWHFCHIEGTAKVGVGCSIGQNGYVGQHVTIGDGCKLQNNVSVYQGVTLGRGVFCGPSCVFTNDLTPRALFPKGSARFMPPWWRTAPASGPTLPWSAATESGARPDRCRGAVVAMRRAASMSTCWAVPAPASTWLCVYLWGASAPRAGVPRNADGAFFP